MVYDLYLNKGITKVLKWHYFIGLFLWRNKAKKMGEGIFIPINCFSGNKSGKYHIQD